MVGGHHMPSTSLRSKPAITPLPCDDACPPQKQDDGSSHSLAPAMQSTALSSSRPSSGNYSTDGTVMSLLSEGITEGDYLAKFSATKDGRTQSVYYNKDTSFPYAALVLFNLPWTVTYDLILDVVNLFGQVLNFQWTAVDPCICKVVYVDNSSTESALNILDGQEVFKDHRPIRAKLMALNQDLQLAITNVPKGCEEDDLESHFKNLVGSKVYAILKRDRNTSRPLGNGIISFFSTEAVRLAKSFNGLKFRGSAIELHAIPSIPVSVHINKMVPSVKLQDLMNLFSKLGDLDDIYLYHRSFAFIKFERRESAERAKRELNNTYLTDKITVRYGEGEQNRSTVQVQFQDTDERDVEEVRREVIEVFSKYGDCVVDVEQWSNGDWRRLAFVKYKGDSSVSFAAALKALDNVTKVGSNDVWCQWARELIPRLHPAGLREVMPHDSSSSMIDFVQPHTDQAQNFGTTGNGADAAQVPHVSRQENAPQQFTPTAYEVPPHPQGQTSTYPNVAPNSNQADLVEVAVPAQNAANMAYSPPYSLFWDGTQWLYLPTAMYPHMRPHTPMPYCYYGPGYPPQYNVPGFVHNPAPTPEASNPPRSEA